MNADDTRDSMRDHLPHDPRDDRLRAVLRMQAAGLEPSAAGWDAITAGIAARRIRSRWVRGGALAGAVLTIAALAVFATRDPGPESLHQGPLTSGTPSGPSAPATTPSSTYSGPQTHFPETTPLNAIWPLTTEAELMAWDADHATYPSLATADGSARAFARGYLGITDAVVQPTSPVKDREGRTVTRYTVSRNGFAVTTLSLRGFGKRAGAPYLVVLAANDSLTIQTPSPGGSSESPLVAKGTYRLADPSIVATLYGDGPGSAPVRLASDHAVTGPPDVWDARLPFTTTLRAGSLLVTNASLRDGGIASAAAVPLWFGAFPSQPPVPETFVAARDGRIALLSSASGQVVRWLTDALPGRGAYDPQLTRDRRYVVYAVDTGTCSSEIRRVAVDGGAPLTLAGAGNQTFANPSLFGTAFAYERTGCGPGAPHEVVMNTGGHDVTVPVDGAIAGGVTMTDRFALYVTTKNGVTRLHQADADGQTADVPDAPPAGCSWLAATWGEYEGNGRYTVVAAARCGGGTRLYKIDHGSNLVLVGGAGALLVTSVDYTSSYDWLILGDGGGGTQRAFTWRNGALHEIPGVAQRPSW
jgi:hypothetical protein